MAGENTYHFIGKLLWRVIKDYRVGYVTSQVRIWH